MILLIAAIACNLLSMVFWWIAFYASREKRKRDERTIKQLETQLRDLINSK